MTVDAAIKSYQKVAQIDFALYLPSILVRGSVPFSCISNARDIDHVDLAGGMASAKPVISAVHNIAQLPALLYH